MAKNKKHEKIVSRVSIVGGDCHIYIEFMYSADICTDIDG